MPDSPDIIGVVKKLQERFEATNRGEYTNVGRDIVYRFPAIASHILDQEERLKKVKEVLEWISGERYDENPDGSPIIPTAEHMARVAAITLLYISSPPTT